MGVSLQQCSSPMATSSPELSRLQHVSILLEAILTVDRVIIMMKRCYSKLDMLVAFIIQL